jgi:hypothetical protein
MVALMTQAMVTTRTIGLPLLVSPLAMIFLTMGCRATTCRVKVRLLGQKSLLMLAMHDWVA